MGLSVLVSGFSPGVEKGGRQTAHRLRTTIQKTVEVQYLLYLPPGYEDERREFALLLFLHGIGERGDNLDRVKIHGPARMISEGHDFPFVVVTPQCPADRWWDVDMLTAVLDEVMEQHRVDPDRVYVTGLSMGGYGTWNLVTSHPDRFAAAVPICGGGDPFKAHVMRDVATWVFHGAKDRTVDLEKSQEMVHALEEAGGNVRFTVYPEAGHADAWKKAYADPELWEWLAKQRRKCTSSKQLGQFGPQAHSEYPMKTRNY
ncbi:MAG: prolyl oligopeptidase family serine peptidase [Fidelibacterota bacterium]